MRMGRTRVVRGPDPTKIDRVVFYDSDPLGSLRRSFSLLSW